MNLCKKVRIIRFLFFYKVIIYLKTVTLKNVNDYKTNKKSDSITEISNNCRNILI